MGNAWDAGSSRLGAVSRRVDEEDEHLPEYSTSGRLSVNGAPRTQVRCTMFCLPTYLPRRS